METLEPEALGIERVLAIGAHPDDCEFYAGAALARMVRAGAHVRCCVVTDGQRGSQQLRDMAPIRAPEQAAALAALGIQAHENLGYCDGELERTRELIAKLVRMVRRTRPDIVLTHDPRTRFTLVDGIAQLGHSDHRATGNSALDAVAPRAFLGTFFPEQLDEPGLELWYPREIWLFDTAEANARLDVESVRDAKLAALRAHGSQNERDALVRASSKRGDESFVRLILRRPR